MITGQRVGAGERARLWVSTTATSQDDIDLVAVERAMNGEPGALTKAEQVEAARRLYDHGLSFKDIGSRVGVTRHTVRVWADAGWPRPTLDEAPIDIGAASHGRSGYNRGCRCRACRDGAKASQRRYREKKQAAA